MSTEYVIASFIQSHRLTRTDFIAKCAERGIPLMVSEDNLAQGKTITNCDGIGCSTDSGVCWAYFDSTDRLCSVSTYSDSYNGGAARSLSESLDIPLVDEHDDEFPKYNSGVDVDNTPPIRVVGDWAFYPDGIWVMPYHVPTNGYYNHLTTKLPETESEWDELISTCNEEE